MHKQTDRMLIYIAASNPQGLKALIERYGGRPLPMPPTPAKLADYAADARDLFGEKFDNDLAGLHPDRDFLLDNIGGQEAGSGLPKVLQKLVGQQNQYSNACGCSQMSNADGTTTFMPCASHAYRYATGASGQQNGEKPQKDTVTIAAMSIFGLAAITLSIGLIAYLKQ